MKNKGGQILNAQASFVGTFIDRGIHRNNVFVPDWES